MTSPVQPDEIVASPLSAMKLAPVSANLALAEWTTPGATSDREYQAPLHIHHEDDEAWYVLEGRLRIQVGDDEHDVPAGAALIGPPGKPHTFWNPDPTPARYVIVMSARTSRMLDALHDGTERTDDQIRELFAAFGCTLLN